MADQDALVLQLKSLASHGEYCCGDFSAIKHAVECNSADASGPGAGGAPLY